MKDIKCEIIEDDRIITLKKKCNNRDKSIQCSSTLNSFFSRRKVCNSGLASNSIGKIFHISVRDSHHSLIFSTHSLNKVSQCFLYHLPYNLFCTKC